MTFVFLLALLLVGVSVVLVARAMAAPRTRAAARLGEIEAYGFGADQIMPGLPTPDAHPGGLGELVRRLGDLVGRRFGGIRESDLRNELMAAGMYRTSTGTLLGWRVLSGFGLGLLTFLAATDRGGPYYLLVVLAAGCGWMFPLAYVRRRARARHDRIDRELPDLIDLIVVTVEAGLSFTASLRVAAREMSGPLAEELRFTLQEQAMGRSTNEALANLLIRSDTPAMRSFVRSVIQGETLGVSTGTIMRNLASEMRKRRRQRAEEKAQKAPIKILFPLIFLIFPVIFIVLLSPSIWQIKDAFS